MASKRLSAIITIGGALSSTFKSVVGAARGQIGEIGDAIAQVRDRQKELNRVIAEQEKLGRAGSALKVQYARQELAQLDAQIGKLKKIETRLKSIDAARERVLARRAELRGQLFDAVALGAMIAAPVRAAVQFESAMADVRKVVDFETPKQFEEMSRDVLKLSTRIPMAAEGIAQIVAAAGQAGFARDELLRFAESAAKMGVAFDITAEQAGQLMAEWRAAFKMTQDEVESLADKINLLGNTAGAASPRISEVVRRVGPLGEVAGVASGEIAALGATLISVGVGEEVAATGIQNLMLALVAGEAATKKQKDAFAELGLDAAEMAELMQKDARGAILAVLDAIRALPEERQASILTQLFGRESVKALAPLLTVTDRLVVNLDRVADVQQYAGAVEHEYAERAKTAANNLQLLVNQSVRLGVTIGNMLLPPLNMVVGVVGKVIDSVTGLAERFPTLTKVVTIGTASLIGMRVATIALGYAFTFPQKAVLDLVRLFYRRFIPATAASSTATTAAAGGPTLLGKAFIWMGRQAWLGVRAVFRASIWTTIAGKAMAAGAAGVKALGGAFLWLGRTSKAGALAVFRASIWTTLAGKAMAAASATVRGLSTAFLWLGKVVRAVGIMMLGNPIGLAVTAIAGSAYLIYKYWDPIKGFFARLWEKVGALIDWAAGKFGWLLGPVQQVAGMIVQAWEPVIGFFSTLWEKVSSVFDAIGRKFEWLGKAAKRVGSLFGIGDDDEDDERAERAPHVGNLVEPVARAEEGALERRKRVGDIMEPAALGEDDLGGLEPATFDADSLPDLSGLGQTTVTDNREYNFTIVQQPGQNARALAEEVLRLIAERDSVRRRSAMYDPAMVAP